MSVVFEDAPRDEDHPMRWCSECGRWIEEPCEHERDDDERVLDGEDAEDWQRASDRAGGAE